MWHLKQSTSHQQNLEVILPYHFLYLQTKKKKAFKLHFHQSIQNVLLKKLKKGEIPQTDKQETNKIYDNQEIIEFMLI